MASPRQPVLRIVDRVLAAVLVLWQPLDFAVVASASLSRVIEYGAPALALLLYRALVVGVGIAVGRGLWRGDELGWRLGRWWAVLHAAGLVLTFATPYLPGNHVPSTKWLLLAMLVTIDAAVWLWLWWADPEPRR